MSYTNYINKLSSETKKALEESSSVNLELQELKKNKYSMKHLNDNTVGYTIKYKIIVEEEFKEIINPISYEILMCYFIENEIFTNNLHIVYNIYNWKNNIYISFFHTNRDYLQNVHSQIIQNIKKTIKEISRNIRIKFSNSINLPFSLQIKILKKEYSILVQTICNIIKSKKLDNSEDIINSIIKILQINELQIVELSCVNISTYKFQEDPIDYLGTINNEKSDDSTITDESELDKSSPNKNIEFINNNIRELFWHANDSKKNKNKESTKIGHSIIFTLIFAAIVYIIPKYMSKIKDFTKNNIVIDNILDLATEDLTQTNIQKKAPIIKKLDTIIEKSNEPVEPNEPNEPNEPSEQPDELKMIASTILRKYNESSSNQYKNLELKNIKDRLKLILEETSTN